MDEIGVSKCIYRLKDICSYETGKAFSCMDCFKKCVQQLKTENEAYKQSEEEAKEIIAELKAENEELKDKLSDTERRLVELVNANTHNLVLLQRCNKCLDEIEEIISKYRVADSNLFMSMDIPNVKKIFEIIKQAKEGVK